MLSSLLDYILFAIFITIATLLVGAIGFVLAMSLFLWAYRGKQSSKSIRPKRAVDTSRVPPSMYTKYKEYLRTDSWRALRKQVFKRDKHRCVRCGYIGNKKQAHHTHYEGIYELKFSIDQLETVCVDCHTKIHLGELPMKKD